jgi:hypothetical protein
VDYSRPPAEPSSPLPFDTYVGAYDNDFFGPIEVAADAGALVLRLGPHRTPSLLRHWDRDVFTYQPIGENAAGPSGVTFQVGPGQTASSVVVENLDVDGQGTFTRLPPAR